MIGGDKLLGIIKDKANIPGTLKHWWWFTTSFSDEYVFVVVNEVLWCAVRIIIFDKPQRWGHGNLQVFKVSEHLTLNGAKEKAEEVRRKLKNIDVVSDFNFHLPVLDFLRDESFEWDVEEIIEQGTWVHSLYLSWKEADSYLRPFDILRINRGLFYHVAIYLGNDYICHFSGSKMGSSGSGSFKVKKDTLKNFFDSEERKELKVVRPVVSFKSKGRMKRDVASAISDEYGRGGYDKNTNNCEHFANLIVLGLRYSQQGNGLKPFTSASTDLKREIIAGDGWWQYHMSYYSSTLEEVRELTQEVLQENSWGEWETRIEVNTRNLDSRCKIQ